MFGASSAEKSASRAQTESSKGNASKNRMAQLEKENQLLQAQLARSINMGDSTMDRCQDDLEKKRQKYFEKQRQRHIKSILASSQRVDLLFLVDCTGSMAPYIREIKKKIKSIVAGTKKFFEKLRIRLSFVGYRDFCDGDDRITVFPFSSDVSAFAEHLAGVEAKGGGDAPEDVFGGIDAAMKQNWAEPNRIMIHVADAPCHGYQFHGRGIADDHPLNSEGLDRSGLSAEMVLGKVKEKNVKYWFHHVNEKATGLMIAEFGKIAQGMGFIISDKDLDEDVSSLAQNVMNTLTESISTTMTTISRMGTTIAPIVATTRPPLVDAPPDWEEVREELAIELYTIPPDSIEEIADNKDMPQKQHKIRLKLAPHPFARGALRDAHFGMEIFDYKRPEDVVMKRFDSNKRGYQSMYNYEIQMEIQCIAGFLAKEFNQKKKSLGLQCKDIQFLEVRTVHLIDRPDPFYANIEPFIKGFQKYNSNAGYVASEIHDEVQAFSHWTFHASNEYLLVVDLQGMVMSDGYCLTDPAIHSTDFARFGATNLGPEGYKCFFKTHTCNSICYALGLQPNEPENVEF